MLPVDVLQGIALFIALDGFFKGFAQGEQVVNGLVGGDEPFLQGHVLQGVDSGLYAALGKVVFAALVLNLVDLLQLRFQDAFQQYRRAFSAAQPQGFLWREVGIAQVLEELESGELGDVIFLE